jgi:hypothetical protein
MVILFTLWLILKWSFPTWLWVIGGLLFAGHIAKTGKGIRDISKGNYKRKKKTSIGSQSAMLPVFLALALTFGSLPDGNAIIQDGQGWIILFILILSGLLTGAVVTANSSNKKKKKISVKSDGEIIKEAHSEDSASEGKNLVIRVDEGGKNKSNFKINLKVARMFSKMIPKKAREEMEKKGIDLNDVIQQIKDKAEVGVLAEVEDGNEHITISIE